MADGRATRMGLKRQRTGGGIAVRDGRTLVEFQPLTGRTHQIRVHAREGFGSGIVGDRVYGIPGGPMLLHASRLVVPRDAQCGDRRHRALARNISETGAMKPEDVTSFPRTR